MPGLRKIIEKALMDTFGMSVVAMRGYLSLVPPPIRGRLELGSNFGAAVMCMHRAVVPLCRRKRPQPYNFCSHRLLHREYRSSLAPGYS